MSHPQHRDAATHVGDHFFVHVHARRVLHFTGNMMFLWVFGDNI